MIYKIYESGNQVVVNYDGYNETHPNKYRFYEIGSLECSVTASGLLSITQGDNYLFKDVIFNKFRIGADSIQASSASSAKGMLDKVFAGVGQRRYFLTSSQSNVSFSGDVEYITFPSAPYGIIENLLTSESVCIGNHEDSVRGTQNTVELRNLSSGSEVKYNLTLSVTCDDSFTISTSSPSGEFQSYGIQREANAQAQNIILSGTSEVTNNNEWTMWVSIDSEGSGIYKVKSLEILVTK